MRLELTGRHITITPALRKLVEQRLKHPSRMLNDSAHSAQVVLTQEKTRLHADVTLHLRGEHFLQVKAPDGTWAGRWAPRSIGSIGRPRR